MALIFHLQGFVVVALAAADIASHIDIGQEIHFNALQAIALASFATASLDVETEAARFVTRSRDSGNSA